MTKSSSSSDDEKGHVVRVKGARGVRVVQAGGPPRGQRVVVSHRSPSRPRRAAVRGGGDVRDCPTIVCCVDCSPGGIWHGWITNWMSSWWTVRIGFLLFLLASYLFAFVLGLVGAWNNGGYWVSGGRVCGYCSSHIYVSCSPCDLPSQCVAALVVGLLVFIVGIVLTVVTTILFSQDVATWCIYTIITGAVFILAAALEGIIWDATDCGGSLRWGGQLVLIAGIMDVIIGIVCVCVHQACCGYGCCGPVVVVPV